MLVFNPTVLWQVGPRWPRGNLGIETGSLIRARIPLHAPLLSAAGGVWQGQRLNAVSLKERHDPVWFIDGGQRPPGPGDHRVPRVGCNARAAARGLPCAHLDELAARVVAAAARSRPYRDYAAVVQIAVARGQSLDFSLAGNCSSKRVIDARSQSRDRGAVNPSGRGRSLNSRKENRWSALRFAGARPWAPRRSYEDRGRSSECRRWWPPTPSAPRSPDGAASSAAPTSESTLRISCRGRAADAARPCVASRCADCITAPTTAATSTCSHTSMRTHALSEAGCSGQYGSSGLGELLRIIGAPFVKRPVVRAMVLGRSQAGPALLF